MIWEMAPIDHATLLIHRGAPVADALAFYEASATSWSQVGAVCGVFCVCNGENDVCVCTGESCCVCTGRDVALSPMHTTFVPLAMFASHGILRNACYDQRITAHQRPVEHCGYQGQRRLPYDHKPLRHAPRMSPTDARTICHVDFCARCTLFMPSCPTSHNRCLVCCFRWHGTFPLLCRDKCSTSAPRRMPR